MRIDVNPEEKDIIEISLNDFIENRKEGMRLVQAGYGTQNDLRNIINDLTIATVLLEKIINA